MTSVFPVRWLAISDLHGRDDLLQLALKVALDEERILICLGDTLDLGPHVRTAFSRLLDAAREGRARLLWGNHEITLYHAFRGLPEAERLLRKLGGTGATTWSYSGALQQLEDDVGDFALLAERHLLLPGQTPVMAVHGWPLMESAESAHFFSGGFFPGVPKVLDPWLWTTRSQAESRGVGAAVPVVCGHDHSACGGFSTPSVSWCLAGSVHFSTLPVLRGMQGQYPAFSFLSL